MFAAGHLGCGGTNAGSDASIADASIADADAADADAADVSTDLPSRLSLTVNRIPSSQNGSEPFEESPGEMRDFTLRVNRANFTLDLSFNAALPAAVIDTLVVRCDAELTLASGLVAAGDPIPRELFDESVPARWTLRVSAERPFPSARELRCEASIGGTTGPATSALTWWSSDLPDHLDPDVANDHFLIIFSRDFVAHESTLTDSGVDFSGSYVAEGNGIPDFDEALIALGLLNPASPEVSARMRSLVVAQIRASVDRCFTLAPGEEPILSVFFEGEPGAPEVADFVPGLRTPGAFSTLAVGGQDSAGLRGQPSMFWGLNWIDDGNQYSTDGVQSSWGVFLGTIVRAVLAGARSLGFLAEFVPGIGTPVGALLGDADMIAEDFDPSTASDRQRGRREQLDLLVEAGATFTSQVVCHEIGHALGLVADGPPPAGLFGDVPGAMFTDADFTTRGHVKIGNNVMASSSRLEAALSWLITPPSFMPLSRAYLRGQLVVGREPAPLRVVLRAEGGAAVPDAEVCMTGGCVTTDSAGMAMTAPVPDNQEVAIDIGAPGKVPTRVSLYRSSRDDTVIVPVTDASTWESWRRASAWDGSGGVLVLVLRVCDGDTCSGLPATVTVDVPNQGIFEVSTADRLAEIVPAPTGAAVGRLVVLGVPPGTTELGVTVPGHGCLAVRSWAPGALDRTRIDIPEGSLTTVSVQCSPLP